MDNMHIANPRCVSIHPLRNVYRDSDMIPSRSAPRGQLTPPYCYGTLNRITRRRNVPRSPQCLLTLSTLGPAYRLLYATHPYSLSPFLPHPHSFRLSYPIPHTFRRVRITTYIHNQTRSPSESSPRQHRVRHSVTYVLQLHSIISCILGVVCPYYQG
ncbi:hypothetical protein GYMLUDRAFT_689438 [Collybiopsis luxurians FD-317 M1]|uniref:Unplaced genomic scaffold GYMLUscaffold_35, whole genome shotgun sequence n=1 Tax=Collybiopsis luxurians FD-317 M1 TaxID=944289 RepID=A0A0D0CSP6_9AGAR|nr:hypothetical protein GYMLUDRAFT_689438 [Collybiopsis luxurians FD-317 M1]